MVAKYEQLGKLIYERRVAVGIATQAELSQRLGLAQQTVSRWEAGTSRPRSNQLPNLASVLEVAPSALVSTAGYVANVTTISFDRPLPLSSLTPESYEHFCLDFLASLFGDQAVVHPTGKTGHKQYGIDIEARFLRGDVHTYQCKREAQFGPEKVNRAVSAQTIEATRKFILLARVASPDARDEVKMHAPIWDLWDQIDITRVFRTLPKNEQVRIVDIYFPTQRFALTGEHTAGPWQTPESFFAPQLAEGRFFNQRWDLVGRTGELTELARSLGDTDVIAVSLIGRAGEGKSRVLLATLETFAVRNPGVRVVVASPTEEVTTKSLEDLGSGKKLIVVDDVHDRSDLTQMIRYAAENTSESKLLLVYRPYWVDMAQRELARCGLTGKLTTSVTLAKPTKQDAETLATHVLTKMGAPAKFAKAIAEVAFDSPLAVVVGAQIVATQGLHPEMFRSSEEFRATVLKHYEHVIASGIAKGKDQDRVYAVLRVLALIQPFSPDDRRVLQLLEEFERIESPDASSLIRRLIDSGVLFKRGSRYRISPDLLADSIIETAYISEGGTSNGHAEKIFAACGPDHMEHILLNLGRLDWRRNEGDASNSTLLDGLWSQLEWKDDYVNAQIKAAAAAAYFQPHQALTLARKLIDEGHGQDESVCRMLQGTTFIFRHLDEACSLLWEVGQNDTRPTNQHPYHPIRILTELATPGPRKPVAAVEAAVDFAISLMDYADSWNGAYTPLDILAGGLTTEGHFTSATSRQITFTQFAVHLGVVAKVRLRIIVALLALLSHSDQRRAFHAAEHLTDALRGPHAAPPADRNQWGDEFRETLEKLNSLLHTHLLPSPILLRICESVQWHAFYGYEYTREPAQRILAHLDRDLQTQTIRALMDAWGSNTWPTDEGDGEPQHEIDIKALCRDLSNAYPIPESWRTF